MLARLTRFFDLRPGETLPVLLCFLYVAIIVASFLLAKSIRNALFLSELGPYQLVYVYVGVPLVLSVWVPLYTRIVQRHGQRAVITGSLIGFALTVVLFWYVFTFHRMGALSAVFFVWVNCFAVIAPVQAWTFATSVFDTRQAKRVFGLIGSGASLGAIAGGGLAMLLARPFGGAINLLLLLAALIGLAAAVINVAWAVLPGRPTGPGRARTAAPYIQTLRLIAGSGYLRLLAAVVFLVAVATLAVGFQFSLAASALHPGDATRLTEFFGRFNFALGIVAFGVQLLLTGPTLRRFGVGFTIVLLPLALGAGSFLIVLFPVLWAVLLTTGLDQSIRFSLDKATYELLYLPLASGVRGRVKVTIDTIVSRLGDGVGGVLLGLATQGFLGLPGLGLGLRGIAALNLLVIGAWCLGAVALRRGYVSAIRESILQHRLDTERSSAPLLERSAAEIVEAKLRTGDHDEIRYALGLLEIQQRQSIVGSLHALLTHPAADIRRRALSILSAANDRSVRGDAERLLLDEDLETRTEALLYLSRHAGVDPLERVRELGDVSGFSIRSGIVAFLVRPGPGQNLDAAGLLLEAMVREPDPDGTPARLEAARLLALAPGHFAALWRALLADPNPEVARVAIASAGRSGQTTLAGDLIERLGNPELAAEATDALASFGDAAVEPLARRLLDDECASDARREIPGVLLRIGSPAAQRALLDGLVQGDAALRFRMIASLNKLRQLRPDLALDPQVVEMLLAAEITGHYRSHQVLASLEPRLRPRDPVVVALRRSMEQEVERIFRLMDLLLPGYDLQSAYVGLRSDDQAVRANALEFLDNVLSPGLRALLVPLLDSQTGLAERVELANRFVGAPVESVEQAVGTLLASDDAWLRSSAAYAAGALGLVTLERQLARAAHDPDPQLRDAARTARQRLAGTGAEPATEPAWLGDETMGVG
jgi:ATP:ADP antiporter, AAA family